MKRLFSLGLIWLLLLVSPAMAQDDATIADIVTASTEADEPEFTVLLEVLTAAELLETLADEEAELTVFAPTDAAFEALLEEFPVTLEDLLATPDLLTDILMYHIAKGAVSSEDLAGTEALTTLQGGEIQIAVNDDDEVMLDDVALIVEADIEAVNGVIHVIDAVLLPPEEGGVAGGEPCVVSTTQADAVRVRVGPGENRTSVSFLPANQDFTPLGQSEVDDGGLWFQLDKEQAAPGRAINEAWVAAEDVDVSGDCSAVGEAAPPPIIPIVRQQPTQPPASDSGGGSSGGGQPTQPPVSSGGAFPANGTWTVTFAEFTNASCTDVSNVVISSRDIYGSLSYSVTVSASGQTFIFDDVRMVNTGGGTYTGQLVVGGIFGTVYIQPQSSTFMVGTLNASFENCSAGTAFSATRN